LRKNNGKGGKPDNATVKTEVEKTLVEEGFVNEPREKKTIKRKRV
jgi:hypothetical protein